MKLRTSAAIEKVAYASAASRGAPQAVQVADRFHVAKNVSEAVQDLLARVLTEIKDTLQGEKTAPAPAEARGAGTS